MWNEVGDTTPPYFVRKVFHTWAFRKREKKLIFRKLFFAIGVGVKIGWPKKSKKFFSNFSNFFWWSLRPIPVHFPPKISGSTLHPSRSYGHLKKTRVKMVKIEKCPKIPPRATQAPPTMVLGITPWGYTTPPNLVRFGHLTRFMVSIVFSQIYLYNKNPSVCQFVGLSGTYKYVVHQSAV